MRHTHLFRSSLAIGYDSHLQTLMQLGRYTVHHREVAPSPMQDAHWLSLSVELSKRHLLAQIMCQSKGQSSAAILRYGTWICLHFNTSYIIQGSYGHEKSGKVMEF